MPVARVCCGVLLRVELYAESDGAEARLAAEETLLGKAREIAKNIASAGKALFGLTSQTVLEAGAGARPVYTLGPFAPDTFSVEWNSFRQPDTAEIAFPLFLVPVPAAAIRNVSCFMQVEDIDLDRWTDLAERGLPLVPDFADDLSTASFAGVGLSVSRSIKDGEPMMSVKLQDFTGLLHNMKVKPGHELDEELPISLAIAEFLRGTPAEGIEVVWIDDEDEPAFGKLKPKLFKKAAKQAATKSNKSYLDAITEACFMVGAVPRVSVGRLELGYAGTVYDGNLRNGAPGATIVLGEILEDVEETHELVGVKTEAVCVVSYDPDTNRQYMARWPPDPNAKGATTKKPHEPLALPPLRANIGLPGYEQLDESVLLQPIGPVRDPSLLPKVAQAIFLERTRQRSKMKLTTHSPTSNPFSDAPNTGDLLRLRAGSVVRFGVAQPVDEERLLPPAVHAFGGNLSEEAIRAMLEESGVSKKVATTMAPAIASVPRAGLLRVNDVRVTGGADKDAQLEISVVNFTVIDSDLEAKAAGIDPNTVLASLKTAAVSLPQVDDATIAAVFAGARQKIRDAGLAEDVEAARMKEIDAIEAQVRKAKAGR